MTVTERADVLDAVAVCELDRLDVERGVAAMVHGRQVALFLLADGTVRAIDHRDPATGANVLARGLLGTTAAGEWYVASPLHKHRYSLDDGHCLNDEALAVSVHRAAIRGGTVHVALSSS